MEKCSLVPRPCAFVASNFILQATNAKGLGTRLGEMPIVLLLQVVKQTVMTVVYGVTWVGGRRQVEVIYFSWKFFVCRNLGTVYTIE